MKMRRMTTLALATSLAGTVLSLAESHNPVRAWTNSAGKTV